MPYYRNGSDSNNDDPIDPEVVDAPTRKIRPDNAPPGNYEDVDDSATTRPARNRSLFEDLNSAPIGSQPSPKPVSSGGDETKIFRRSSQREIQQQASQTSQPTPQDAERFMEDPVVGWVAIIEGPGRGTSLPLGYGMNDIGRNQEHRVVLDFGDIEISREKHATITYDPKGRKFYLLHGGGKNLTYLDDTPVLIPVELPANQNIQLGQTTLRFVPLCGAEFDWQDQES